MILGSQWSHLKNSNHWFILKAHYFYLVYFLAKNISTISHFILSIKVNTQKQPSLRWCVYCVSIALWARSPSALFIAARVICVFITSQQWDLLFVDLAEISEVCVVTSPTLLASIHGVRPLEDKNDIPSTNCKSIVFVLLMTGLLPPTPRHKCGVRVWWQRCGLSVLSIPVASGPAVLHQATLPTLASSSSGILYRGWSPFQLSAVVRWFFIYPSDTHLDEVFLVTGDGHVPW